MENKHTEEVLEKLRGMDGASLHQVILDAVKSMGISEKMAARMIGSEQKLQQKLATLSAEDLGRLMQSLPKEQLTELTKQLGVEHE